VLAHGRPGSHAVGLRWWECPFLRRRIGRGGRRRHPGRCMSAGADVEHAGARRRGHLARARRSSSRVATPATRVATHAAAGHGGDAHGTGGDRPRGGLNEQQGGKREAQEPRGGHGGSLALGRRSCPVSRLERSVAADARHSRSRLRLVQRRAQSARERLGGAHQRAQRQWLSSQFGQCAMNRLSLAVVCSVWTPYSAWMVGICTPASNPSPRLDTQRRPGAT